MEKMSKQERQELLELYKGARVADVRDAMDWYMMHSFGTMCPCVLPLFRTIACGIAKTARYLPFQGPIPNMTPDEYSKWVGMYYREICKYPWEAEIEDGDFVALDLSGLNVGLMGSANSLRDFEKGCRGFVINGGARDTDEIIIQKIPFWTTMVSQPMVQGRIQYDAHNIPIAIGGVVIYPEDIIVGDGDGVIVVPRKIAYEVGKKAAKQLVEDKAGRRAVYDRLGWEPDPTVII